MTHLQANLTIEDQARATRALLAWWNNDTYALDVLAAEVIDDPAGTPGLLFALLEFVTQIGDAMPDTYEDGLHQRLATLALGDYRDPS